MSNDDVIRRAQDAPAAAKAPPALPRVFTVAQVADTAQICRASVYNMMNRGELASVKLGRSRRITEAEIQRVFGLDGAA